MFYEHVLLFYFIYIYIYNINPIFLSTLRFVVGMYGQLGSLLFRSVFICSCICNDLTYLLKIMAHR